MPTARLTSDDTRTPAGLVAAVREVATLKRRVALDEALTVLAWVEARALPDELAAAERSSERIEESWRWGVHAAHLAGPGAPVVAEHEVYEVTAALGLSRQAGCSYVGELVELRYRLPRIWARVVDLSLPLFKARRIAERTVLLPEDAAAYVDAQLAWAADKTTWAQIDRTVAEAVARFAPELAPDDVADELDVRLGLDHPRGGVVALDGLLDLVDAHDLEDALQAGAAALRAGGSEEPLGARRARTLGDLARGQASLDLEDAAVGAAARASGEKRPVVVNLVRGDETAEAFVRPGSPTAVCVEQVAAWCSASTRVTVREVLDLGSTAGSDAYVVPRRLAEQVRWLHPTCVFPECRVPSVSCDLDHLEPYADGGPTAPHNLAPLCRRHHRAKTHTGWRYRRLDDGVFEWTGPMGQVFRVDDRRQRPKPSPDLRI